MQLLSFNPQEWESLKPGSHLYISIPDTDDTEPDNLTVILTAYTAVVNHLANQKNRLRVILVNTGGIASGDSDSSSFNSLAFPLLSLFFNLDKESHHIECSFIDPGPGSIPDHYTPNQSHPVLIREQEKWFTPLWKKEENSAKETNGTTKKKSGNKAYVISGGFGAIGQHLCIDLLGKGATHIYIPVRGNLNAGRETWLKRINQQYQGKIYPVICDISSSKEVEQFFKVIEGQHQKLEGIYHLAGVLYDEFCGKLDPEHFKAVVIPKLYGAYWLHKYSNNLKPASFILFSSASAYFANPGQAAYAAANACLNNILKVRLHEGLPAKLIAWGPWEETGMAAGLLQSFRDSGIKPFNPEFGLRTLEQALQSDHHELLAIDLIKDKTNPEFQYVSFAPVEGLEPKQTESLPQFNKKGRKGKELEKYLLENMNRIAKDILKLDENTPLSDFKPFFEVGFNSLSLNQYRNKLNRFFGSEKIVVSILFKFTTINSLCQYILNQEKGEGKIEDPAKMDIKEDHSQEINLLNEISQLSDKDIEAILNEKYSS